jgi:Spy/CpxP family protein refolding chaperone
MTPLQARLTMGYVRREFQMKLHTNVGAALAAAFMIPALALAQDPAPPPPDAAGRPGMGMHRQMMGDQGPWGGERRMTGAQQEWGRGHGMGMHGWGGHGMGMRHRDGMGMAFLANNPDMRKRLGITDDQATKIRQQSLEFRKAEIRSRADLQVKRLELRSLLASETPDRAAIDKTLQEVGAAQMALEKSAIDFHLAARTWLTPEQRQKLREMREQFRPGGQGPRGGPAGPRGMRRPAAPGAPKPQAAPAPPQAQ